jgi:hypothetical protein
MDPILLQKSPGNSIFSQNPTLLPLHISVAHASDPHDKPQLIPPPHANCNRPLRHTLFTNSKVKVGKCLNPIDIRVFLDNINI